MGNKNTYGRLSKTIECCAECVAPKRHVGCHSTCKEYKKEREAYDEKKRNAIEQLKQAGRVMGKNEFNMLTDSRRSHSRNKYIKPD